MPVATHPAEADPPSPPAGPGLDGAGSPSAAASWALSAWDVAAPAPAGAALPSSRGVEPGIEGMLRSVLHDLRNALSALQLGVELLGRRDDALPPASSAVLTHMGSAAQRAQALTVELDDLAYLAAGRGLPVSALPFPLHTVVRDALDASRFIAPGVAVEHDRLGEGDCVGDPARVAQFLHLALEEFCAMGAPARVIVVSEVAGERFRLAVHAEGVPGTAPGADDPAAAPARARARRRVLLQAVARAHGGAVGFDLGYAPGVRSIEGSFSRLAGPSLSPQQDDMP